MAKWTLPEGKIYTQADLDAAVAAERERCAKVAETYEQWATDFGPLNPEDVAEHIAAAIRAQQSP